MNLKRVLMMAVFAAIALPGAAHAQVRFGVAFGGGYRPYYYRPGGVRVFVGLPPVAIGFGGPVYVQPAPVVYPAPVYVPAPVAFVSEEDEEYGAKSGAGNDRDRGEAVHAAGTRAQSLTLGRAAERIPDWYGQINRHGSEVAQRPLRFG